MTGVKRWVTNTRRRYSYITVMGFERDVWDVIGVNIKLIKERFYKLIFH